MLGLKSAMQYHCWC